MYPEIRGRVMKKRPQKKYDMNNLIRLLDYFKYLYEEEKQRNEKLNSATNTYLVVITFAFSFSAGLLSWLSPKATNLSTILNDKFQLLLILGLGVSILILLLSLIFTLLVIKVRQFERLCSPVDFATKASIMENEDELISSIISNYVVATERNFLINNKKARFLTLGMQAYLIGFILLLISLSGIYITGR
jgi:hypothetical protein